MIPIGSILSYTLDSEKGKGWTQTILAGLLTLTWIYFMAIDRSYPVLDGIMGLIVGIYFGHQAIDAEKEENEKKDLD